MVLVTLTYHNNYGEWVNYPQHMDRELIVKVLNAMDQAAEDSDEGMPI